MTQKFLGIGEPGYRPLRKLRTVFFGPALSRHL
jgi:hypothetical protein